MDLNFFFPSKPVKVRTPRGKIVSVSTATQEQRAARFCRGSNCPILVKCGQHALENNEPGVWGGTTTIERKLTRVSRTKGTSA